MIDSRPVGPTELFTWSAGRSDKHEGRKDGLPSSTYSTTDTGRLCHVSGNVIGIYNANLLQWLRQLRRYQWAKPSQRDLYYQSRAGVYEHTPVAPTAPDCPVAIR